MGQRESKKQGERGSLKRWWWFAVLILCIVAGVVVYAKTRGGGQVTAAEQPKGPSVRAVPVGATQVRRGDMSVYINGLGSVTPLNMVTVHSRVDGQLMEVLFKEGQIVKAGELLAQIDPRPFEVMLSQAEGQMAHDRALLENARIDLDRYKVLWQQDSIPKQQLDTQEALVRQYEGQIKTDQAQIDNAKLQLVYSRITSPITGKIGLRLVDPGNIIHAADVNGFVVITQLQPITVIFPIPEDNLPPVIAALNAGRRLPVEAFNRQQTEKLATGVLLTVDNQIDQTTGTVKLKATFDNADSKLFPNQFVNARLLIDEKKGVLIAPSAALQRGPQGAYVYVVKADHTASVRPVTVGEVQSGEVSIASGLSEGELVVTDGAERLREGIKVDVKGQGQGSGSAKG